MSSGLPLVPEAPFGPGWTEPSVAHLLALAVAASFALRLSHGWWAELRRRLEEDETHPGYPLWLAATAFLLAYVFHRLYLAYAQGPLLARLLDKLAGGAAPGPVPAPAPLWVSAAAWLTVAGQYAPYLLAAVGAARFGDGDGRLSPGRGSGALSLGADPAGWAAVRPAYRTVLPWAAVLLVLGYFPASSEIVRVSPQGLLGLVRSAAIVFAANLLVLPLFLGVITPAVGRNLREAMGSSVRSRLAARVLTAVLGAGITLAWAAGLAGGWLGATGLHGLVFLGVLCLAAALVHEVGGRGILWAPLATALLWTAARALPLAVRGFIRW